MIRVFGTTDGTIQRSGEERLEVRSQDILRVAEQDSIADFVRENKSYLTGRVLDFGAGKPGTCRVPQPYRGLVSGAYTPYDVGDPEPVGDFDAILCTQAFQYFQYPMVKLTAFREWLARYSGVLVMTYPTNWPEVETTELFRYTRAGMESLLARASFEIIKHEPRASLMVPPNEFVLGYGVVARVKG